MGRIREAERGGGVLIIPRQCLPRQVQLGAVVQTQRGHEIATESRREAPLSQKFSPLGFRVYGDLNEHSEK